MQETQRMPFREFKKRLQDYVAEPHSEEGQEVIHNDKAHVAELWEDGEITTTKSGDLYKNRSLHGSSPPFLPERAELFDTGDSEHKRMVITDDEIRDIIENMTMETEIGRHGVLIHFNIEQ